MLIRYCDHSFEYSEYYSVYIMYSAQLTDKQRVQLDKLCLKGTSMLTRRDRVLKALAAVPLHDYRLKLLRCANGISSSLMGTDENAQRAQEALYHGALDDLNWCGKFLDLTKANNPAAYTVIDRYLEDTAELTKLLEQNISPEMRKRVGDELLRLALIAHDKVAKIIQHDACALSEIDARDVERDFAYEEERRFNDVFALEALEKTNAISEY